MEKKIITEDKYRYIEVGEGTPIIILHGLMGGLSNFNSVIEHFPTKGYKVIIPELPIYDKPLLKTYKLIVYKTTCSRSNRFCLLKTYESKLHKQQRSFNN